MSAMDEYLGGLPPDQKAVLERVRAVIAGAVPDAEEGTSYGMPAFLFEGRPLVGFRAAKKHLSVFPFSPVVVDAVSDRLEGFDISKGTIRFSADHPLPDDVVTEIARTRLRELTARR